MGLASQTVGPVRPRTDWERERKFVTTPEAVVQFLAAVEPLTVLRVHDLERPIAYNRTTYLDTAELTLLRSSRTGPVARKLRIREYASAETPDAVPTLANACYLELKESGDSFRSKIRLNADPALLTRLWSADTCSDSTETLEALYRLVREERVQPKLTTWYRRVTRLSLDEATRITVDSGLCFARPMLPGEKPLSREPRTLVSRVPFPVVEVKCAGEVPQWLAEPLEPLREVPGFSKFETGMAHLYPEAAS